MRNKGEMDLNGLTQGHMIFQIMDTKHEILCFVITRQHLHGCTLRCEDHLARQEIGIWGYCSTFRFYLAISVQTWTN